MASGQSKSSLMTSIRPPVELERIQEGCGSRRMAPDRHQDAKRSAQRGADGRIGILNAILPPHQRKPPPVAGPRKAITKTFVFTPIFSHPLNLLARIIHPPKNRSEKGFLKPSEASKQPYPRLVTLPKAGC